MMGHYFMSDATYQVIYVSRNLLRYVLQVSHVEMDVVLLSEGTRLPKPKPLLAKVKHLEGGDEDMSSTLEVDDANVILSNFYVEQVDPVVKQVLPLIAPGLDVVLENNNLVLKKVNLS